MKEFANQMKEFRFYPEYNRDPLKWFKQGPGVIGSAFRQSILARVA